MGLRRPPKLPLLIYLFRKHVWGTYKDQSTLLESKFFYPLLSKNSEVVKEVQLVHRRLQTQCDKCHAEQAQRMFSFIYPLIQQIFIKLLEYAMCWLLKAE